MNQVATKPQSVQQRLSQAIADPRVSERLSKSLSPGINQDQFLAQLQISLGDRSLKDCTYDSLYNAAHFCATLALLPSLNQVALIPREMKRKDGTVWGILCVPMPQWQGYKAIMERHPDVLEVIVRLVHREDMFEVRRDPQTGAEIIIHERDPFSETRRFDNWGDVRGGYLEITYVDRTRPNKYHFTSRAHMEKCAKCAETTKIWDKWFEQMLLKTVYRDGFARRVVNLDVLTAEMLSSLAQKDDEAMGNSATQVEHEQPRQVPQRRTARLAQSLHDDRTIDAEPVYHDPEPEADPEPEPKAEKKPAKRSAKKSEPKEPSVPEHLKPAVEEMAKCRNTTALTDVINQWSTQPDDFDHLRGVADWLIETGKVPSDAKQKKQGNLVDSSEQYE